MSLPTDIRSDIKLTAYIALGSNLGDSRATVLAAIKELSAQAGLKLIAQSALYRSKPYQAEGEDFVNAVIAMECWLNPVDLLKVTQRIENEYGRVRSFVNAPRTLDLDLILFGQAQIQSEWLQIPHPRWTERAFVMRPLQAIAPHLVSDAMLARVCEQAIELLA